MLLLNPYKTYTHPNLGFFKKLKRVSYDFKRWIWVLSWYSAAGTYLKEHINNEMQTKNIQKFQY